VLRLAQLDVASAAVPAARVQQLICVVGPSTIVALIAPRAFIVAVRTDAFDVAVRQPLPAIDAVELGHDIAINDLMLQVLEKHLLGDGPVVFRVGFREQIEADPQLLHHLHVARVVAVHHLTRRDTLLLGAHRDRRAVGVGAGNHQHVVPAQPVIAREDVRRQIGASDVADVHVAVAIRPGDADEDLLRHVSWLHFVWQYPRGPGPQPERVFARWQRRPAPRRQP